MKGHCLKIDYQYFEDILSGRKNFEVRKNDRDFKIGEKLLLKEYSEEIGYTGRELVATIVYVLKDFVGLQHGYVVLGIADIKW